MMHFFNRLKHHMCGLTPNGLSGTDAPIVVGSSTGHTSFRIGENQRGTDSASTPNCAICLSEINTSNDIQLPCAHHFHQFCVQEALRYDLRCPTCRQSPYLANTDRLDQTTKVYMPIVIGAGVDQRILQLSPDNTMRQQADYQ